MEEAPKQLNSEELKEAVKDAGIIVMTHENGQKREINCATGEEAFFALLAHDMIALGEKYKKDVDEVHKMFFEVNCDRNALIKRLEGEQVTQWTVLEDLALQDKPENQSYLYVAREKGENEVEKRKRFLEII